MKKPLISASEIPAIVKEFLGKSYIKTYDSIETVITRKFFLTQEERRAYDEAKNAALGFIFNKGKDFEEAVVAQLTQSYGKKYSDVKIIDFNNFYPDREEGKKQKLLICNSLSICCVPDLLVITEGNSYNIIEIKSSDYNTEMLEAYKYQVAMQGMLLSKEYHRDARFFNYRLILQETSGEKAVAKTFKVAGGSKIWGSFEDVEPYQTEISVALTRLWEAYESGELEKYRISLDEMIKPFVAAEEAKVAKEVIEVEDKELAKLASEYLEEKEREKAVKYLSDTIKKKVGAITSDSIVVLLQTEDGTTFRVSRSVSKPVFWTPELKEKELQKARAIELGTMKTDCIERLSIKI